MVGRVRIFGIILVICFSISCCTTVPIYAYQGGLAQGGNIVSVNKVSDKGQVKTGAIDDISLSKQIKPAAEPASKSKNKPFKPSNLKPAPVDRESLWYSKKLPLKKEHQKVLWDYCKSRKLDYIDMLALIYTESNFNEKCTTGASKGYFQISKGHFCSLSKTLKTPNKPLDGKVNINWGTAMYSWILQDKRVKNLKGKKKRDVALSIYQRGTGGYDRRGISYKFLKVFYKKRGIVCSYFKK